MQFDNLHGLEELKATLQQLPLRMQALLIRKGLRAGAIVIRDETRRRAPREDDDHPRRKPGTLQKGITVRAVRSRGNAVVRVSTSDKAFFGKFVEGGHLLGTRGRRVSRLSRKLVAAGIEFGTQFVPAHPFMRPAFEAAWQAALDRIASAVRDNLDSMNLLGGISDAEADLYRAIEEQLTANG